ncbi:MAG: hypothetical protein ACRDRX_04925 [Pseudonocardiaceae bacterium]
MAEVTYDVDAAMPTRETAVLRVRGVPDPQFPTKIPAGRRSSTPLPPAPGRQPDPTLTSGAGPPLIDSPAAAQALCDYFLANAERGDNAANDELITELVRRIRVQQAAP